MAETTIKEAIIKALAKEVRPMTYKEVYETIIVNKYFSWDADKAKTPKDTVAALLGDFIRNNDTRVKRVKSKKGYQYYLAKYEEQLDIAAIPRKSTPTTKSGNKKVYQERDLHKLLSSYLKNENIFSKTIAHEKSSNSKDNNQKWIHPDMIGIKFLPLKNKASNALMKVINKSDAFDLYSYEIKREITTDYELKKCFFQAVSNSSWANYGYLVAFDISSDLHHEIDRLSQSFGIGVIELKSNPFQSEVLFPARYSSLDFKTIDKICLINTDFEQFIQHTEHLLIAQDGFIKAKEREFEAFCDDYFPSDADSEIKAYLEEKGVPFEEVE